MRVFTQAYPAFLMMALVIIGVKESVHIIRGWSQYVRDEEYLVGRQLHNLHDENDATEDDNDDLIESGLEQELLDTEEREATAVFVRESSPWLQRLPRLPSIELEAEETDKTAEDDDADMPKHFGIQYSRRTFESDDLPLDLVEVEEDTQHLQSRSIAPEEDTIASRTRSRRRLMDQEASSSRQR